MINLRDRLSHLNYRQACKLLGPEGERLIKQGGKYDFDITEQVSWGDDVFRLDLGEATVTLSLKPERPKYLGFACSECSEVCEHVGAAFSLILEEKLSLGLSAPPPEKQPVESLSEEELVKLAIEERAERAKTEKMQLKSMNREELWTDYTITSHSPGKSYRVALRGWERGDSYCSCPDFRKNTLGTCKHLLYTIQEVRKRFSKAVRKRQHQVKNIALHLRYGEETELRILVPDNLDHRSMSLISPLRNKPIKNVKDLLDRIKKFEQNGREVTIYPDAEEYINSVLYLERIRDRVADIRKDPKNHPLRKSLLKAELLPYQLDGIAFAVGTGRAVLADDMGLGKTIQGIGVAELLSQEALLICRMAANSTFLVDKVPPGYSSKLVEFENLIDQLIEEEDRKIVLFSEWTTMLGLIEPLLKKRKAGYVRLDGSVPQKKRQGLIHEFQRDPDCKLFITTNAGATGLNLQGANTVINVDLPWNPAVLEQRISRVHRMGQKRPVQAFLLVTEETLEEKLLGTLSAKHELALAALDPDSRVKTVGLASGMEELKRRLEILLGAKPAAALDESRKAEVEREAEQLALREKVASAGGQLLGAAFAFIGEMLPKKEETEETLQMAESLKSRLSECLEKDQDGRLKMTITFPDESLLHNLAKSLAQILGSSGLRV